MIIYSLYSPSVTSETKYCIQDNTEGVWLSPSLFTCISTIETVWSSTDNLPLLKIPKTRFKSYGDAAFSVAVPNTWNYLQEHIRSVFNHRTFQIQIENLSV